MKYYVEITNRIELSFDYHLLEIHGISLRVTLYSGGIEGQCEGIRETIGSVKTREGETKRESR